ncbi:MAG: 16S rRNA (adenine(1518)-N(6)/adenine(1519)-N(6))-dimethyltransferase RsmA [Candidatus Bathyarchaeia archaeon]
MSLLSEAKRIIRRYRLFPKKRWGQHFLVELSVLESLTEYADLKRDDIVLEIGAGLGFLTQVLAMKCGLVCAVEIDPKLVKILQLRLRDLENVKIIEGDVLRVSLPDFNKIVSVPPYGISSELIQWLIGKNFASAVLVFQREFANKLSAPIGSDAYSWLTVIAYYHFNVEILDDVPRWMFYPPPDVDSVIVRLTPKEPPPFPLGDKILFKELLQALFTQRNRKVRNALRAFIEKKSIALSEEVIERLPFQNRRVRELAPEDFGVLANVLSKGFL